jgi:glyoxalase family protein
MESNVLGIHHITAITDDPQHNINFYAGVLGLRLVKKTVNFDVPDTYHFYYGDDLGHPGTILTFFSWPGYPKGRRGSGQATIIAFSIPESALAYWQERLAQHNIQAHGLTTQFGEQVLSFNDQEGLGLALVGQRGAELRTGWTQGPVPAEHAIRGFHSVTLSVTSSEATKGVLTQALGFRPVAEERNRARYEVGNSGNAALVDVLTVPEERRGVESIGTVHHVAWRTADDAEQLEWRSKLTGVGLDVTPVMDRTYFHSIYFREPGGVLFEIATDLPGFAIDEAPAELGTHLRLPPWLESQRPILERDLPPVSIPYIQAGVPDDDGQER